MTGTLSTTQSVKQSTRQLMSVAQDKMKLASSAVGRGDTRNLLRMGLPSSLRVDPTNPWNPLELDVAVIKSTTPQFHVVPKEKHVRTLKDIVHNGSKDQVREVIKMLLERLKSATDWLTALKALMVIHRLMRECSTIFLNALAQYSTNQVANAKGKGLLNMGNFLDTTNIDGRFDFSEWVRGYGKYLDEQLEVYKGLNFYPEMEHGGESSRMRTLSGEQLLKQLPVLQRLQQRLMDCKPSGAAAHDPVVQTALMAVLKESFKVYKAISEGIINLADRFFEMEYLDAQKGLEIYKESIVDNTRLQEYYTEVEEIEELKRAVQFPKLENLPPDFLTQMEGYVKEAPRPLDEAVSVSKKKSPPLRRGTKAAGGKVRFETAASGHSTGTSSDPGMIGAFTKAGEGDSAKTAAATAAEPNLLDLEELTISEPSPAATGPSSIPQNGFSSQPSPAGERDPFAAPLQSPFTPSGVADSGSSALSSGPSGGGGGFSQNAFKPSHSTYPSPGAGNNPFGPASGYPAAAGYPHATNSFQLAPGASSPSPFNSMSSSGPPLPQQFPSGLPQVQQPAANSLKGGGPMVAQQPSAAHRGFAASGGFGGQPSSQGLGSYPSTSPAPTSSRSPYSSNNGFGTSNGIDAQQSALNFGGQLSGAGSRQNQLGKFGSSTFVNNSGPSAQPSPSKPATGTVVAAGLTRPTNVVLAKEAALHDPFAGLASLKPSTTPKYSPPLKNMSPSPSTTGQPSNATSPGLQSGSIPQPQFGQGPAHNSFQSFGVDSNGLGASVFGAPTRPPASIFQTPVAPQAAASSMFDDNRGDSLI